MPNLIEILTNPDATQTFVFDTFWSNKDVLMRFKDLVDSATSDNKIDGAWFVAMGPGYYVYPNRIVNAQTSDCIDLSIIGYSLFCKVIGSDDYLQYLDVV